MRLLSALFDTVLLPIEIAKDAICPWPMLDGHKSFTRKKIEKIEENLTP